MGASSERLIWGAEECRLVLGWRLPTAQLRRGVSSWDWHGYKKLKIREKWATSLVRKSRAESQPKPSRSQILFGDAVGTVELVQNFQQPGPNLLPECSSATSEPSGSCPRRHHTQHGKKRPRVGNSQKITKMKKKQNKKINDGIEN